MKKVIMYTWTVCPFCVKAKRLLNQKGIPFEEINLDNKDDELDKLRAQTGWKSVPQIFIGNEFIGGCDDLYALEVKGDLDHKLKL